MEVGSAVLMGQMRTDPPSGRNGTQLHMAGRIHILFYWNLHSDSKWNHERCAFHMLSAVLSFFAHFCQVEKRDNI